MKAELYALTHRGNPGDVAFYGEVCRGAKSVLELGSGSGRLLTALAGTKRRVVGLELEPELLALAKRNLRALPAAKRKSVRVLKADMRDFELPQRFERVLLPYNALYCLLEQARRNDAAFAPRIAHSSRVARWRWTYGTPNPFTVSPERTGSDDADPIVTLASCRTYLGRVRALTGSACPAAFGRELYVLPREGGIAHEIPIAQRYFLAGEISDLLERAGFVIEARYGDFSGRRFNSRSAQLVVIARA